MAHWIDPPKICMFENKIYMVEQPPSLFRSSVLHLRLPSTSPLISYVPSSTHLVVGPPPSGHLQESRLQSSDVLQPRLRFFRGTTSLFQNQRRSEVLQRFVNHVFFSLTTSLLQNQRSSEVLHRVLRKFFKGQRIFNAIYFSTVGGSLEGRWVFFKTGGTTKVSRVLFVHKRLFVKCWRKGMTSGRWRRGSSWNVKGDEGESGNVKNLNFF